MSIPRPASTTPRTRRRDLTLPTAGGAAAFWLTNFAISLTPVAAHYRAALSIAYVPMLVEALIGGLVIAFCVSYVLLRVQRVLPTTWPLRRSVALSFVALLLVTVLLEAPSKFLGTTSNPAHYFLVGTLFNALRILALGVAVGSLAPIMWFRA